MPPSSMTGFGRAAVAKKGLSVTVEIRSTNHRFLKVGIKLPSTLARREQELEALLRSKLARGSVEVSLRLERTSVPAEFVLDEKAILNYHDCLSKLQEKTSSTPSPPLLVTDLLSLPGVVSSRTQTDLSDEHWDVCLKTAEKALRLHISARKAEGKRLAHEITQRVLAIKDLVAFISKRTPSVIKDYQQKLRDRVNKLLVEAGSKVDDSDLLREIALYTDRTDITEELERLASHLVQLQILLKKATGVGREVDFLLQEMFREINTIGSKASDAEISHKVVAAKVEIEKIREQVQNLE